MDLTISFYPHGQTDHYRAPTFCGALKKFNVHVYMSIICGLYMYIAELLYVFVYVYC